MFVRDVEVDGARTNVALDESSIVAVGPDLRPERGDDVIEGRGAALIPGLHDHHLHLAALAAAAASIVVGPPVVRDQRSLADALTAADATAPPDGWIRGVAYHETVAGDIDRWTLDHLVSRRPVRVQHRSGGLWVVNSKALAVLGLLDGSLPEGCEVDDAGIPTGRLWRLDRWLGDRVGSQPPDFGAVGRHLLHLGVTGVTDMTPYERAADFDAIATAVATAALPQHVAVTGAPHLEVDRLPSSLHIGPAKLLLADHDLPSLDDVIECMRSARRAERAIAVHCVTRVSLVLTLAAFEVVGSTSGDRIEHGAVIPRDLDDTIRSMGLTVVTQPNFVTERGDEYLAIGDDDRHDLWRCASLLAAGVAVAAGTDAPFGQPDPWALITAAASRRTPSGAVLLADERIEPERALTMLVGRHDSPAGPVRRVAVSEPSDVCLLAAPLRDALAAGGCNPVRLVIRAGRVCFGDLD
jgi:predicted amidohydrolase YtcJ